ncbi:hypothetical protein TTHERM_001005219 (macronuclear) [Tetrahymena thermophila SB210]|uniref:Uncharacterized protein n=1 Tax=Tetrahymena thermophila (strain SB210) TaxID=312017 RepID=W7XG20_TETTS|nr:hypothetical protein TTHERM_001005219 [Tetrahymena thermophila SB210]EWS75843.1 hypothetical protein TTHERM_001005219 [Tetrahymena thermophila SB210]|eukprot:XP_012651626.1 hypothetical protein TTHERM_001005219 [Tetrahymena thermophila SB210]
MEEYINLRELSSIMIINFRLGEIDIWDSKDVEEFRKNYFEINRLYQIAKIKDSYSHLDDKINQQTYENYKK